MNLFQGSLSDVCQELYFRYGLSGLYELAVEDTIGGYQDDGKGKWGGGSVYEVEGQLLYALVRCLQSDRVVQIGGFAGCSASHLGLAVQNNQAGRLTSVDIDPNQCRHTPVALIERIDLVTMDGVEWLRKQRDHSIDILFEDADHTPALTAAIATEGQRVLKPGGFYVAHDAAHFRVGADVRQGLDQSGMDYNIYRIKPGQCGLAIWRKDIEHGELS